MPLKLGLGLSPVLAADRLPWTPGELSSLRAWYDAELGQPKYGGDAAYVQLDGTSGDYVFTPDSAALDALDGDIEVVMRVWCANWATGSTQTLAGRYVSSGNQRCFRFYTSGAGAIGLSGSPDGTSGALVTPSVTPTNPLPTSTWFWLRMRLDLSNGSNSVGSIDTAADTGSNYLLPVSWTANGSDSSKATISGIFTGTAPLEIGSFSNGTLERFTGRVGRMIARDGFDGPVVRDFNASDCYGDGYWHTGGYRWSLGLPKIYDRSGNNVAPATFGSGSNQPQWLPWVGRAQVYLPGVAGNYVSAPDAAVLDVTGDLELVARVTSSSWAAFGVLIAKYEGVSRSYRLDLNANGTLRMYLTADGTTDPPSASSSVSVPFVAGQTGWVKATWRQSDGRVQYFTAADQSAEPSSWTQLGSDRSIAIASIHSGTSRLEVGSSFTGAGGPFLGGVHRAIARSGIDGTTVADFNAELCTQSGYTDSLGNVWTVNRSTSGRKTVVQSPAARSARSLILHGTDDWIVVPVAAVPSLGLADSATITTAVRQHATAAGFRWYWAVVSGGGTELMSLQQRTTNACKAVFSDGVNTIDSSPSPAFTNGAMTVVGSRVQARSSFAAYVNGGSPATQSPAAVGALTPAQFTIAALAPASAVQEFEFGSLLTRDIAESDTEHGLTVAYYGGGL